MCCQVEELLYRIGKPLGFSPIIRNSDRMHFMLTLQVPCRSGLVHYTDMYEHLSRRCIDIKGDDPLQTLPVSPEILSVLRRKISVTFAPFYGSLATHCTRINTHSTRWGVYVCV